MAASWHTSALVSNLPEGSLVRSRSVLNSLWNCSCVPWSAYSAMTFWASRLEGWRRRPALEFDPRQDQVLPARADRALDQSQHAARGTQHAAHGAIHAFLGDADVVHREGVDVQRQPSARQHAVVGSVACEQPLDHRQHLSGQRRSMRIHALEQRRARRQQPDVQSLLEELVATQILDGVEVALATPPSLHQQAKLAANDVAGGHAGAHRQGRVDIGQYRSERLQEMPDQGQAGGGGQVVIELLDFDGAHGRHRPNRHRSCEFGFSLRVPLCRGGVTESGT